MASYKLFFYLFLSVSFFLAACSSSHTTANANSHEAHGFPPTLHQHHPTILSEEMFLVEMIPHHQEAIDTSRVMLTASNPQLRALAQQIITAQEAEIEQMETWLKTWYPSSSYQSKYVPMMPDLSKLSGVKQEVAYLTGMIEHHRAAVEMAKQVQALPFVRQEILVLADAIIAEQEKEISLMESMLLSYKTS
ncbi:MAG: DUF305 domain-containing protein [Candidatus Woesearchaeota archaeon]